MRRTRYGLSWLTAGSLLVAMSCTSDDDRSGDEIASSPSGPAPVTVLIDAPSPPDSGLTFTEYFPSSITVHPGDTVSFDNEGDVNPHSVTFGAEADGSNMPRPVLPDGSDNPVSVDRCVSPRPPAYEMAECPDSPLKLPPYDGSGFWSSGIEEGSIDVPLDAAIPVGSYPFFCSIHIGMGGTVEVVPAGQEVPSAADVAAQAVSEQEAALAAAAGGVATPKPSARTKGTVVIAGWATPDLNVNLFGPDRVEIDAGDTVTWSAEADYEHIVQFSDLIGGEAIDSGPISTLEGQRQTFSVEFPDPGTYEYICVYHAVAMVGVVTVT